MPRVTIQQNNFTAGEITPKMYGRTDVARYQSGAKEITNGIVQQHGGIQKRGGLVHVANAKDTGNFRLIRFVYNRDQAYVIEMGAGYFRFYTEAGQILDSLGNVYEVANTFTQDELSQVNYVQDGATLYLVHRNHAPAQLVRINNAVWQFSDVRFTNPPVKESVFYSKYKLFLGATTGSNVSASSAMFMAGMFRIDTSGQNVSRKIYSRGGGEAIVTAVPAAPNNDATVTVTIINAFESTTIEELDWWIDGQPQVSLVYTGSLTVGSQVTVANADITTNPTNYAVTITAATETTVAGKRAANVTVIGSDVAKYRSAKLKITYGTSSLYFVPMGQYNAGYSFYVYLPDDVSAVSLVSTTGYLWLTKPYAGSDSTITHPDLIGSIISFNGGLLRVTDINVPTSNVLTCTVVKSPTATTTAIPDAWLISLPAWTLDNGYPCSITMYQQRMVLAGTTNYPNTIWFSKTGNVYDYLTGVLDDDAIEVKVVSEEVADIIHLAQTRAIFALSSSGEFSIQGGIEKPITPTNIQISNQSVFGCSQIKPQRIGNELYFPQRAGRKIRALAYKEYAENASAPDLSIMSEHLTETGIVDMCYQSEPSSVLWLAKTNGNLVSVTVERDQDVIAWAEHETDGDVFTCTSLPTDDSDVLYVGVMRDGTRRIEKMADSVYLDASVSGTSGSPTNVWTGLDHLNGKTVSVVADGVVIDSEVVSGGQITIDRNASAVQIGLPYTLTIKPVTQDLQGNTGSSVGNAQRVSEVTLRVKDSLGCKINGDYVAFSQFNNIEFGDAIPTFSGMKSVVNLGWHKGEDIDMTITHDQPYGFHLLAIIYKYQSND